MGAVLPILHLNGYKIANPTVLGRLSDEELVQLFNGYGYKPYFVEGHEPDRLLHTLLRHQIEKRRLCQLNLQTFFQRAIKRCVSGAVDEISHYDRVALGQLLRSM